MDNGTFLLVFTQLQSGTFPVRVIFLVNLDFNVLSNFDLSSFVLRYKIARNTKQSETECCVLCKPYKYLLTLDTILVSTVIPTKYT